MCCVTQCNLLFIIWLTDRLIDWLIFLLLFVWTVCKRRIHERDPEEPRPQGTRRWALSYLTRVNVHHQHLSSPEGSNQCFASNLVLTFTQQHHIRNRSLLFHVFWLSFAKKNRYNLSILLILYRLKLIWFLFLLRNTVLYISKLESRLDVISLIRVQFIFLNKSDFLYGPLTLNIHNSDRQIE